MRQEYSGGALAICGQLDCLCLANLNFFADHDCSSSYSFAYSYLSSHKNNQVAQIYYKQKSWEYEHKSYQPVVRFKIWLKEDGSYSSSREASSERSNKKKHARSNLNFTGSVFHAVRQMVPNDSFAPAIVFWWREIFGLWPCPYSVFPRNLNVSVLPCFCTLRFHE